MGKIEALEESSLLLSKLENKSEVYLVDNRQVCSHFGRKEMISIKVD